MLLSVGVDELAEYGYWFPTLYALAFITFGVRLGTRISLGFYALTLGVGMGHVVPHALSGESPFAHYGLWQVYASSAVLILALITFARMLERQAAVANTMTELAHTDVLTELDNRRRLEGVLRNEMARAERYGGSFAVFLLDIDHFKLINDRYGHEAGDEVLRELAELLRSDLRALDRVGRWGGEEFLTTSPRM